MNTNTRKYGLFTAIAMIVGIVIGSGIFFKVDDILIRTDGDVAIGGIAFIIGAIGIIFAGLSLAIYARENDEPGGLINYMESVFGKKIAFLTGWFQSTVYFPTLCAILAWISALYTQLLFSQFELNIWLITLFYLGVIFAMNFFAPKLAGYFQVSTTSIKLIPLILLGVLGVFFGQVSFDFASVSIGSVVGASSAIVAVAFAYDGWSIAPSIAHEIKDSKKNLPKALIIAPIIIMCVYLAYYFGVVALVGPNEIMELGNTYIEVAFTQIFGPIGAKLLLVFVVISVLGTTNGLVLGGSRVPYSLALRHDFPFAKQLRKTNDKTGIPSTSMWTFLGFSLFWLFIHFLVEEKGLFSMDVSELPIIIMYLFYSLLFIGLFIKYKKKEITSKIEGIFIPTLALLGAFVVLYGGFTGTGAFLYLIISVLVICTGYIVYQLKTVKK